MVLKTDVVLAGIFHRHRSRWPALRTLGYRGGHTNVHILITECGQLCACLWIFGKKNSVEHFLKGSARRLNTLPCHTTLPRSDHRSPRSAKSASCRGCGASMCLISLKYIGSSQLIPIAPAFVPFRDRVIRGSLNFPFSVRFAENP